MNKLQFKVTVKQGLKTVAEITGREIDTNALTVEDVTNKILDLEQHFEKLTGLRCHVEQVR